VPRLKLSRGAGVFGVALTAFDVWRRLPPKQRRWVARQAKKHGPRLARQAFDASRARRR
jgi:hypothetical protein